MRKQSQVLRIVGVLVGGILGYVLVSAMYESGRQKSQLNQYDSYLLEQAESFNRKLPQMVDAETRLDKVAAGSGRITYFFSLPDLDKTNLDLPVLQDRLRKGAAENYKTNAMLAADRAKKIVMGYEYKDKNGMLLFGFSISPKDF